MQRVRLLLSDRDRERLLQLTAYSACLVVACSSGKPAADAIKSCPIGDLTATAEIELLHADASGNPVAIQPLDEIMLEQPPQGGWVFYVIPHVRNMDGCGIQLTTSLTDTCSNALVVFESRPISLEDDGTGWGVPINISDEGLVAACPQAMITRNLDGVPYGLDVVAVDRAGRRAESKLEVVPTCSDPYCSCQCDQSYHLGDTCSPKLDAGVDGGGCP